MISFDQEVSSDQIRELAQAAIYFARNATRELTDEERVNMVCAYIQRELDTPDGDVAAMFWSGRDDREWDSIDTITGYIVFELNYC